MGAMSSRAITRHFAIVALVLVTMAMLIAPLGQLFLVSLRDERSAWTLANYRMVLTGSYYVSSLAATLGFCAITSLIAVALALPAAWRIGTGGVGATVLRIFCQMNYAFGSIVYGMLILVLFGNAGLIPVAEGILFSTEHSRGFAYTISGLALGYLGFQIPRSALVIAQAIENMDPNLIRAARTLGADGLQIAAMVIVPTLRPALSAAFVLTFLMSVGSFGIALLVAKDIAIYPVIIFKEFTGFANFGIAAAMAITLCLLVILVLVVLRRNYPDLDLFSSQAR